MSETTNICEDCIIKNCVKFGGDISREMQPCPFDCAPKQPTPVYHGECAKCQEQPAPVDGQDAGIQKCPECGHVDYLLKKCEHCGREWRSYAVSNRPEPAAQDVMGVLEQVASKITDERPWAGEDIQAFCNAVKEMVEQKINK